MSLERLLDNTGYAGLSDDLYLDPDFLDPPVGRPCVFINMVSTVDGKILQGQPGSTAKGLGSKTDQMLMHRLRAAADGAIIGASTLRAGTVIYPPEKWRAVVTHGGNLPMNNRFFTDAREKAIVFAPSDLDRDTTREIENHAALHITAGSTVDVAKAVEILRRQYGIERLLLEGGSELNFQFLKAGIVDELFLSLAPKIKGGRHIPTIVGGEGLPGDGFVPLNLVSVYHDGGEMYLRYRFERTT